MNAFELANAKVILQALNSQIAELENLRDEAETRKEFEYYAAQVAESERVYNEFKAAARKENA